MNQLKVEKETSLIGVGFRPLDFHQKPGTKVLLKFKVLVELQVWVQCY